MLALVRLALRLLLLLGHLLRLLLLRLLLLLCIIRWLLLARLLVGRLALVVADQRGHVKVQGRRAADGWQAGEGRLALDGCVAAERLLLGLLLRLLRLELLDVLKLLAVRAVRAVLVRLLLVDEVAVLDGYVVAVGQLVELLLLRLLLVDLSLSVELLLLDVRTALLRDGVATADSAIRGRDAVGTVGAVDTVGRARGSTDAARCALPARSRKHCASVNRA